ncbi:glycosyltransferase family 2 protein [Pseudoalteromonas sp. S16_S37]|uniref:glycosyltransferase family 2 protein n=1 Tax=Pseudoalteromonas sp. S16_S37 TaxID=2720228 RepID=UPI001680F636|nr:glycosyltransferase family A protein [Pseudoalteromonas sp. S16_S37]MBD1582143.1 glycosyltransferase family 2 protein [Pseudoalteromonas sp. S16_S37]
MKYDVSVVIPNFNCKQYLPIAFASILKQRGVITEIIVVDDGSDDGSIEWLELAQKTLSNLVLIKQHRSGVVAARNRAIGLARAPYIAFLDADDYWIDDKLKDQLSYMKAHRECVLSFTNYMHVTEQYQPIIDCFSYWPEFYQSQLKDSTDYMLLENPLDLLLCANVIGTSSVMVSSDAIKRVNSFNPSLKSASDWDCWLNLASIGNVAYTYRCAMGYLMRSDSITANRTRRIEAMQDIIARVYAKNPVSLKTKIKTTARMSECHGEYQREQGKKFSALFYAVCAFSLNPHKRNAKHLIHDLKQLVTART